ncbi:zf-HC2 domain-containing protein [Nonomuraea jiangxiensis]|uniref:Putative zinc-finger n=1 Tax=Nonomuraea jiangxiensis TaxID=633440 RepID=A0A1G8FMU1_9ACTN|nr:zf-HC2 domain-containing protein [Nonomuraea jiangxiensis]SDH83454.1 Putative zinc-finger [Nonomuraea jiangxiensis]
MTSWHIPDDLRGSYLEGTLEPALAMSVDAHLDRCAECRAAVPYDKDWLEASWARLETKLVTPRPGLSERFLWHVGVPDHLARLLSATPTMSRAWLAAVVAVLAFAVLAAREQAEFLPAFLIAAPVLPLAGIALAYGPRVDPVHELVAATPMSGPRLLLARATAVLTVSVVLAGIASPLLPAPPGMSAAWLLPALAAGAGCLALSNRLPVPIAALAVGGVWLAIVGAGRLFGDWPAVFGPAPQIGYAAAALLLIYRFHRLSTR